MNIRLNSTDSILAGISSRLPASLGLVPDVQVVNKFGEGLNFDVGINSDVWDRNNITHDQDIWLAPTAARIHAIVSTDATDTNTAGVGARKIRVWGLKTWDTLESSEDINLAGVTPVNTVNSYVIIHRMRVIENGGTSINAGTITATAATDATVTAQIQPLAGQTQMAIYGVPSVQNLLILNYYASVLKTGGAVGVDISVLLNETPATTPTTFIVKHTNSIVSTGAGYMSHQFDFPPVYAGPCIIKIQGNSTVINTTVSGGFTGILTTK